MILWKTNFLLTLNLPIGGAYIFSEDRIEDDDGEEEEEDPGYIHGARPVYLPEIHLPRNSRGQLTNTARGTEQDGGTGRSGSGLQRSDGDRRIEVSAEDQEEEQDADFGAKILQR
jgi:hypothetical protein